MKKINEALSHKEFLIMDHRGFWGGNIIQNSREASILSYRAGADIVEIDVCRTKDGEYYLFHDGNEKALLGEEKHFTEWTAEEIDSTSVGNTMNDTSGYYLEKLEAYLEWLPEGKLINIDRAWFFYEDPKFINILKDSNKIDQFLLKSPVEKVYLDMLNKFEYKIPFMPIVKEKKDFEMILSYENIQTVGLEVIPVSENHELFDKEWLIELKKEGYLILGNSVNLGPSHSLFADLTDDRALMGNPDEVWGKMIDMGITIIQTDWPNFLDEYREKRRMDN